MNDDKAKSDGADRKVTNDVEVTDVKPEQSRGLPVKTSLRAGASGWGSSGWGTSGWGAPPP